MSKPAFIQAAEAAEARLSLRNPQCRSLFFLHPQPTQRVFLFFHGITAAPYQFRTLGQLLYQSGYNVLVPLMPGHGLAGNWNAQNPPPLPSNIQTYQTFATNWMNQAKTLGKKVIVGGLSAGGCLAAWLGVERALEIDRTLLFAPYLSNASVLVKWMSEMSNGYFAWVNPSPDWQRLGYPGVTFPGLRIFPELGQQVIRKARTQASAPLLMMSTEIDRAVDNGDHRSLFESVQKRQPISWYYNFPQALNVPHAMMAPEEGNQWTSVLNRMVKAYVESSLTWAEVEEIAYRMTQGKTFPQVVQELGVQQKCSPDMPTLITMLDKRQIFLDRNSDQDS